MMRQAAPNRLGTMLWVMVAVVVSLWWWAQSQDRPSASETSITRPLLTLQDASTYRYNAAGEQQSQLNAEQVRHFNDGQGTFFAHPDIHHQVDANTYTTITARSGHMSDDKSLISMRGDALAQRYVDDTLRTILRSSALDYRPIAQTVSSDEAVNILTPESDSDSVGALWRLADNYFILQKNVRTHYAPSSHTALSTAQPQ